MMNGPMTNFEPGKIRHREYEAEVSPPWGQNVIKDAKLNVSKQHRLTLTLSGVGVIILLIGTALA